MNRNDGIEKARKSLNRICYRCRYKGKACLAKGKAEGCKEVRDIKLALSCLGAIEGNITIVVKPGSERVELEGVNPILAPIDYEIIRDFPWREKR